MKNKKVVSILILMLVIAQLVCIYRIFLSKSIVFVDTNQLLENYEGMKAARLDFQQKAKQWQANIDTLKSELNQEISEFEDTEASMTLKERELNQKLIDSKRKQLLDYQKGIQQKSQQEDYQMTEQVLTEVNAFIEAYGKKKGYKLILGANSSGSIVYAEDHLDITEDLLKALNDDYSGL